MQITREWLKDKNAGFQIIDWFNLNFGTIGGYIEVIHKLLTDNKKSWAIWILNRYGPVDDILEIKDDLTVDNLIFPGTVKIKGSMHIIDNVIVGGCLVIDGSINICGDVLVNDTLKVKGNIKATGPINVHNDIEVDGNIKSDFFIVSTGSIKINGHIEAGTTINSKDIKAYTIKSRNLEISGSVIANSVIVQEFIYVGKNIEVKDFIRADGYEIGGSIVIGGKHFNYCYGTPERRKRLQA